ncbi:VOC family protein [Nocardia brasiliensis]|uniref:VOC family protein n=1 Tax=Nocardia brasiliensis TaxID=37326 RepID=UPI00366B2509
MPTLLPSYHVGIVVADLARAMAEFGKLGVEWHAPVKQNSDVFVDGATVTITPWMVYSKQGPPYLELLEQVPGTIWAETGLHHLGLWADNVPQESQRLSDEGLPLLVSAHENTADAPFCYHLTADGVRLELIDIGRAGPGNAVYLSGAADEYLADAAQAYLNGVAAQAVSGATRT